MKTDVKPIIYVSSWTSVVLILWGMVTGILESSFVSWFSFVFFVITPILVYAAGYKK